jgi:hypothetical protein
MASKSEQKSFIEMLIPYAEADYLKTGVLPSITIAQAIHESGWGNSGLTKNHNNAFGIKADSSWTGAKVNMPTKESVNGVMVSVNAFFRKYSNIGESIRDHSDFFWKNKRYVPLLEAMKTGDYKKAVNELGRSGYATDPNYGDSIRKTIEKYDLDKLDKGEKPDSSVWLNNANENGSYGSNTREELEDIENAPDGFFEKLNPMDEIADTANKFVLETLPNMGFIIAGIVVSVIGIIFLFNESSGKGD